MVSVFDLFKVGIGPSSSHTMGPMRAALAFREALAASGSAASQAVRLEARLFGSLAWTGKGHATDRAVILGLLGFAPDSVDADEAEAGLRRLAAEKRLAIEGRGPIGFDPAVDVVFDLEHVPAGHPNTLTFSAFDETGAVVFAQTWHSVGGGFIVPEGGESVAGATEIALPHPFRSALDLVDRCEAGGLTIAELVLDNEQALRPRHDVLERLDAIVAVMFDCIDRGMRTEGELPGGLKVRRRACALARRLEDGRMRNQRNSFDALDRVNVYAIAVNEENAAGGRVVTAPTNGASGVMPAVLRYYREECSGADTHGVHTFMLTAGAIGALFKMNASISGAEVGCQGEVGVASSMAAAGLAAALGASNLQVENAAEIAMEHHLGMTCDPIGGLVQIPCIERNAFGAVKAINAAQLALSGDGSHRVSLDQVIATMRETGADMQSKYKETSRGGLAVNVPEC